MDSPGASWGRRAALGRPPSGLPAFGAAAVAGDETGHEAAQSGQTLVAETAVPGLPINLRGPQQQPSAACMTDIALADFAMSGERTVTLLTRFSGLRVSGETAQTKFCCFRASVHKALSRVPR